MMKQPAGKYFCSKNTQECSNLLETTCYTITHNMPVLWHPYNCGLMCSFSQKIFRLMGLKELAHWCWTTTDSQRAPAALSIHSGRKKPNPLEHSSFFWTIKLSLSLSICIWCQRLYDGIEILLILKQKISMLVHPQWQNCAGQRCP